MSDTATEERTVSFNLPGKSARDIEGGDFPAPTYSKKGRGHTAKWRNITLGDARAIRDALHDAGHRDDGDKVRDVIDDNPTGEDPTVVDGRPLDDPDGDRFEAEPPAPPTGVTLHRDDIAAAQKYRDKQAAADRFHNQADAAYCCGITDPGFVAAATDGRCWGGRFVATREVSYVAELHRRWTKRNA